MKQTFTSWLVGVIVDSGMDIALKALCRYVDESETELDNRALRETEDFFVERARKGGRL